MNLYNKGRGWSGQNEWPGLDQSLKILGSGRSACLVNEWPKLYAVVHGVSMGWGAGGVNDLD